MFCRDLRTNSDFCHTQQPTVAHGKTRSPKCATTASYAYAIMVCGARSVAGLAPLLGVGSWNLVLPDGGQWKHVAVVPYRLVASSVSLSKKRVCRSDATNSKCLKHATGVMHFVRSAKKIIFHLKKIESYVRKLV